MDWKAPKLPRTAIRVRRSLKPRRPAAVRAVYEAAGVPHFGPMPSLEREITDFDTDVLQRSQDRLVLAEFWAPWCTVGQRLHPALDRVAARHHGGVVLASINIEMHAQVLGPQNVHGLPMVKAYFKGIAIGEMTGVLPEPTIDHWVDSLFEAARLGGLLPTTIERAGVVPL